MKGAVIPASSPSVAPAPARPLALSALAVTALLAISLGSARAEDDEALDPAATLARARELVTARQPRKALALFQRLIEGRPPQPSVYADAAECAFQAALYEDAIRIVRIAAEGLKQFSDSPDAVSAERERLKRVDEAAKREIAVLKQLPATVATLIKRLDDGFFDKVKLLEEPVYSSGDQVRRLKTDRSGLHLAAEVVGVSPRFDQNVGASGF